MLWEQATSRVKIVVGLDFEVLESLRFEGQPAMF